MAGVVIGPYVLGRFGIPLQGLEHGPFPIIEGSGLSVSPMLYAIATLGSIVLLFMSGLETDLRMFFRYSVAGTTVGLGGVIFSYLFGAGLGMLMYKTGIMDPRCMFLGILSTATSVGITARILSEHRSIDSPEGTTILAAAVIDDVLGIICLAIVMGLVGASGAAGSFSWMTIAKVAACSIGLWLGVTALGLFSAHKIAQLLKCFMPSKVFSVLALGLAMLLAGLFQEAGLAMIVGAYVMGLCLSKTDIRFSIQRHLNEVYNFLVPVFFVVMGMMVDIRVLTNPSVLKYGLLFSALAIFAKILGCALPALFMNFNLLGAIRIGAGMVPRGEVALIIAGIGSTTMMNLNGTKVPIVDAELFGIAIIMTLLTTVLAPPLLSFVLGISGKGVRHETEEEESVHSVYETPSELFRDFVLISLKDAMHQEGFRFSDLESDGGIIWFRREEMTFALHIQGNNLVFESSKEEAVIIRAVMYETMLTIYKGLEGTKKLKAPGEFDEALEGAAGSAVAKSPLSLARVISTHGIVLDLQATDYNGVLVELVENLAKRKLLTDKKACLDDILARESEMTTCLTNGIALPHARSAGTQQLQVAIGISRKGIKTPCGNGDPVKIIVLSVCPKNKPLPYLQFISQIAGVLESQETLNALLKTKSKDEVRRLFIKG